MPTSMLECVRCEYCNEDRQRQDMSPFRALCSRCFNEEYVLCGECGALLIRSRAHYARDDSGRIAPRCHPCRARFENRFFARWESAPLDASFATYKRIGSKRKYGVEIETHVCEGYENLHGNTKFGCKTDSSICGREFDSPILYGDEGFAEIEKLLKYGAEKSWRANFDCGCHIHYDMRDESIKELYRIAYAYAKTYIFWSHCVSDDRRQDNYCHAPLYYASDIRYAIETVRAFRDFARVHDRYDYVNLGAYNTHKTFEIRLLEGTVEAETICNWVTVHARFIDYVKCLSLADMDLLFAGNAKHVFTALIQIVNEKNLTHWLAGRINEFSPGTLN